MENYKPNSFKYREEQKQKETASNEKRIQKVINGPVTTKKRNSIRKLRDSIITEDVPKVKEYIMVDVLIPTIKRAISDIVRNGIDMFLYGDAAPNRDKRSPVSKVSYRSYYEPSSSRDKDRDRDRDRDRSLSRSAYDYDDIILTDRGEAELVLSQMEEIIDKYGFVRIADLYDLVGVSTTNHCINNYGWTNLSTAKVVREYEGYSLKLPRALPID